MNRKEKAKRVVRMIKQRYGGHVLGSAERSSRNEFEILLSCILSQRTKDEMTEVVSARLFAKARTPKQLAAMPVKEIESLIRGSNYHITKAKNIKALSQMLIDKYDGRVPKTRKELMELPSVGGKTADIVLSYGYGHPTIAVDVHVFVIAKRLGLVPKDVDEETTHNALDSLIPDKDKLMINSALVEFGKEICRTRDPNCGICPLYDICIYEKKTPRT